MTMDGRRKGKLPHPGPYLAEITNHLDSTHMGKLEVALKKGIPSKVGSQGETYVVKYLSPFYGIAQTRYQGNNSGDFDDVQKSYGMWMIPPDVGSTVMVIFIEGDPNEGYWFGCALDDAFQNHMVPGIAASDKVIMTPEQRKRYGSDYLPVAEFLKKTQTGQNPNPESYARPVHPFADRLLSQGLLLDRVRGVTSSGARRDVPSQVFGISTPGPLDPNGKKGKVGYDGNKQTPVSRLGGATFVMDDGDVNGDNELVRIRTRTGHQILMHNSHDLIYIANAAGTAWIEMTAQGKIDIYAGDSVSIHSEADFNFRADRDINLEAGRNFNVNVGNDHSVNLVGDYSFIANDGKLKFTGSYDKTVGTDMKMTVGSALHIGSSKLYMSSAGTLDLKGATNNFSSSGDTNIASGGNHFETAGKIHMNGPAANQASAATAATAPSPLGLFSLPNRSTSAGWGDGNYYNAGSIASIMQRVPTHEPWDQHENIDPVRFTKTFTDTVIGQSTGDVANSSANQAFPQPNKDVPADWSKDLEFINKVKDVCKGLGCNYIDLLCCMQFESGMNPAQPNLGGGSATGLIQFIESTAKTLGTTTAYLRTLTRVQQMDWVEKYFKNTRISKVPNPALSDVYMCILGPAYCGQPDSTPVYSKPSPNYYGNSGLDVNGDGTITKAEATAKGPATKRAYVMQQLVNAGVEKPG